MDCSITVHLFESLLHVIYRPTDNIKTSGHQGHITIADTSDHFRDGLHFGNSS